MINGVFRKTALFLDRLWTFILGGHLYDAKMIHCTGSQWKYGLYVYRISCRFCVHVYCRRVATNLQWGRGGVLEDGSNIKRP